MSDSEDTKVTDQGSEAYDEAKERCGAQDDLTLPAIDFTTFVMSLSASVAIHLGELDNPERGGKDTNMGMARQSIDLLSMLQDKTRGNLDTEESRVLENVLYDLRMKYVAKCHGD